jgi:hypothetical protein
MTTVDRDVQIRNVEAWLVVTTKHHGAFRIHAPMVTTIDHDEGRMIVSFYDIGNPPRRHQLQYFAITADECPDAFGCPFDDVVTGPLVDRDRVGPLGHRGTVTYQTIAARLQSESERVRVMLADVPDVILARELTRRLEQ